MNIYLSNVTNVLLLKVSAKKIKLGVVSRLRPDKCHDSKVLSSHAMLEPEAEGKVSTAESLFNDRVRCCLQSC